MNRFLWSEGVKTSEVLGRMTVQYGDSVTSGEQLIKCLEKSKGTQVSVVGDRLPLTDQNRG
jgi:hypothetical protein